jgi:hypothetical protein
LPEVVQQKNNYSSSNATQVLHNTEAPLPPPLQLRRCRCCAVKQQPQQCLKSTAEQGRQIGIIEEHLAWGIQQLSSLVSQPLPTSILAVGICASHPYLLPVVSLALMAGLLFKRKIHFELIFTDELRQALAASVLELVDFSLSQADEAFTHNPVWKCVAGHKR